MDGEIKIPIFPLGVVLMPNGLLPLHIFEERYKEMINESLSDNKMFGIVYLEDKYLHKTGCTARVNQVIKRYEDGRMDIWVSGHDRFRIIDVSEEKAYLQSNISYFDDTHSVDNPEMAELAKEGVALLRQLEKYTEISQGLDRVKILDFKVISFLLAGSIGLTLAEKQNLLEIDNTEERLIRSVELLKSAVSRAKMLQQIRTIRSDTIMTHGFSKN